MTKDNNGNGSYWKGTVDQKLDMILDKFEENKEDHTWLKEKLTAEIDERKAECEVVKDRVASLNGKVRWIIGVGTGVTFCVGVVLAFI